MTLIYGQQFIDGIIITADSRASKLNPTGKYDPWKDNTQKIFRIKGHLFVGFCGDIDFAGSIISFLINEVRKNPKLENIHVFTGKAPKLVKFAYKQLCLKTKRRPSIGFIFGGIDFNRKEPVMKDGKVIGHMSNIFDKKTFKIESPDFKVVEASEFSDPVILGSGSSAIKNLQNMVKDIYNFGGFGNLDSRALILSGRLKEEAEKLGINSVGGQFQIVVIDPRGSRFVGYKSRSQENKDPFFLDLEMIIRGDGRWVQRDLKTGKEIVLLYPPEVVRVDDDSQELFSLLEG